MTDDGRVIGLGELASWGDDGRRLVVFVGVTTGGSRIHREFPAWAERLGRPEWVLRGIDLPLTTSAEVYRELIEAVAGNPNVAGAVVTSHKLRLHRAAAGLLRTTDTLSDLMLEVNALARTEGGVDGFARDPLALTAVLGSFEVTGRDVVVYGAGGAGTALLLALTLDVEATLAAGAPVPAAAPGPASITVLDTDDGALAALRATAERCGVQDGRLRLARVTTAAARVPDGALVVNASGLGKDRPGSPLPPGTVLPPAATAWDFNYRGDLTFLADARAQGATAVDGWEYFVAGWRAALTAIAGVPFAAAT